MQVTGEVYSLICFSVFLSKEMKNPKTDDSFISSTRWHAVAEVKDRYFLSDEMANMCAKYRIYKIEQDLPEDAVTHPSPRKYRSLLAF